jgi:large subunit ribosomal protein L23
MNSGNQDGKQPEPHHYAILKSPVLTEKAMSTGLLVLTVDPRANKTDIRVAVERVFKVKVVGVRTARYNGKPKRVGRSVGKRAGYKKAYITLAEGSEVNVLEGV